MKPKLSKSMRLVAAAGFMGLLLSGCAWQIGGDKKGTNVVQTTRGQELIDLKKALDQGAITQDEYQAQRQKIIQR
ncbi:MAG TPA: SHOCT domain-containing protein [Verrucomicrobiae bacterium]|nr:SHOCT domain-containing protein [Verrucomicrobiae bacterium]